MSGESMIMALPALLRFTSGIIGGFAKNKEQKAYEDYLVNVREAAMEQYRYQTRAINNRLTEEEEASDLRTEKSLIQNMRSKASLQASIASNSINGSTIDNLYKDYDRVSAATRYVAAKNLHLKGLQSADEKESAYINAMNTINRQKSYTKDYSIGLSLLNGIYGGLSSYMSNFNGNKNKLRI